MRDVYHSILKQTGCRYVFKGMFSISIEETIQKVLRGGEPRVKVPEEIKEKQELINMHKLAL